MNDKLILDTYKVGNDDVYGLKQTQSTIYPDDKQCAGSVLLPTYTWHTRFTFASIRQKEILIQLGKRLSNGYDPCGAYCKRALLKVNQCTRIMTHYQNEYSKQWSKPNTPESDGR